MTIFQIIAICLLSAGTLVALGFLTAFVVVTCKKEKSMEELSLDIKKEEVQEVEEIDLDAMLAKLEAATAKRNEEKKETKGEEVKEVVEIKEEIAEEKVEAVEETITEEPVLEVEEEVENVVSDEVESQEQSVEEAVVEESAVEEAKEDEEEIIEEVVEDVVEEETTEEVEVEEVDDAEEVTEKPTTIIINTISEEKVGPEFDYRVRLEKIKESQARIDRDLDKTTRAIMKYERTVRRKERNQKMLDRRALELTNLNLLMYSVTDIKNVDAEKKARQEELTAHIAELKASIQDAENYLDANKEKHENNLKLRDYLAHEKTRYADEVKELETAIASGKYFDDNGDGEDK